MNTKYPDPIHNKRGHTVKYALNKVVECHPISDKLRMIIKPVADSSEVCGSTGVVVLMSQPGKKPVVYFGDTFYEVVKTKRPWTPMGQTFTSPMLCCRKITMSKISLEDEHKNRLLKKAVMIYE